MIDLHTQKTKLTISDLEDKILDFFEGCKAFPSCIYLNRDQFEMMLDVCGGNYATLTYRGIPVELYIEEKIK